MGIVSAVCAVALLSALVPVHSDDDPDCDWWRTAVLYQIYPRSFKDSNGDGVGDLKGIIDKAEYLRDLGITAVWLSPIYKSPQKDFGYDISDYLQVDPMYGSNDVLVDLIKTLKSVGLKLILDYVPNHTSDQHEWFQKSVEGNETYKDFYVWRNKSGDDANKPNLPLPPNNWVSVFSGSAWKWNEKREQFYLHEFVEGQPDLNYNNPAVVEQMKNNLKFWMDLGVDGFRIDACPYLFEDDLFRNEVLIDPAKGRTYENLNHTYTKDQLKTYDLLKGWAEYVESYSKLQKKSRLLLLEAYTTLENTLKYYVGPESAMPFNFRFLEQLDQNKQARHIMDAMKQWRSSIPKADLSNWVIGNHDNPRITTRMGLEFADAMNIMLGMLPGIMVTYNGEELGMEDTFVRWDQTVDPSGLLLGQDNYLKGTRDPERTPMQWDSSPNAGFTNGSRTWLPVNPNYWRLNAEAQKNADASHLKVYQQVTAAKKTPTLKFGSFDVNVVNSSVLTIERLLTGNDTYVALINFGSSIIKPDLSSLKNKDTSYVVYTSSINSGFAKGLEVQRNDNLELRPKAAVILKTNAASSFVANLVLGLIMLSLAILKQT